MQVEAQEIETKVLGNIFLAPKLFREYQLFKSDFFDEKNRIIFEAIAKEYENNLTVDVSKIMFSVKGQVDAMHVSSIIESAGSLGQHKKLCAILRNCSNLRQMNLVTKRLYDRTQDSKSVSNELINGAIDDLRAIKNKTEKRLQTNEEIFMEMIKGVPVYRNFTGIRDLDNMIRGVGQTGQSIVIGARSSIGKTALMVELVKNFCINGAHSAYINSLEMSNGEVMMRLASNFGGLEHNKIREGVYKAEDYDDIYDKIVSSKLIIDDRYTNNINEIRGRLFDNPSRFCIIDHLHLMASDRADLETITRQIKQVAKERETNMITLAQLNRDVDKRGGASVPQLSDLRNSGSIEADADLVLLLHRYDYYGLQQVEINDSIYDTNGLAVVNVAKNRHGATGLVFLKWEPEIQRFSNYEDGGQVDYQAPF